MADSFIDAARKEAAKLRQELGENAIYQRLQAVERVIQAYERSQPKAKTTGFGKVVVVDATVLRTVPTQSKTALIEAAAVSFLSSRGRRATSGEILKALVEQGFEIGGKKPGSTMASYLSNSKKLNSVSEKGGYGLAEWGDTAGPRFETNSELPLPMEGKAH